jgi:hypothetical protein
MADIYIADKATLDTVNTNVTANKTTLATMTTNLATANNNISTIKTDAAANKASLATLTTNLATVDANVDTLVANLGAVKSVQRGIATSSASTNRGWTNTVTISSVTIGKTIVLVDDPYETSTGNAVSKGTASIKLNSSTSITIGSYVDDSAITSGEYSVPWQVIEFY